jgi:GPI mannosyltransferase 3
MRDPNIQTLTPDIAPAIPRSVWIAFYLLLAVGVLVRCMAGSFSLGIVHPDEHQQYLEAAQKIVYGYNVQYWEYDRGIRHYLYPCILADLLFLGERLGISDPVDQAALIRILMGVSVFACFAAMSYRWMRQGRTVAALFLMVAAGLYSNAVFMSVRTLSETAVMIPLLLALLVWDRSRITAGMFFGLCFAVRFQSAFFILGAIGIEIWNDRQLIRNWLRGRIWQGGTPDFIVGLAIAMLFLGAFDRFTWGAWFHSPIEYFRANICEGVADSFGVKPFYQYFAWYGSHMFLKTSIAVPFLVIAGWKRQPRWAFLGMVFFLGHCAIGHKEARFLWPLLPLVLLLASEGFEVFYDRMARAGKMKMGCVLLALTFLPGYFFIDWRVDPTYSVNLALTDAGKRPDNRGTVVVGLGEASCGNYFFLRKHVPYAAFDEDETQDFLDDPRWQKGDFNYLVIRPELLCILGNAHTECVSSVGEWGVYRIREIRLAEKTGVRQGSPK